MVKLLINLPPLRTRVFKITLSEANIPQVLLTPSNALSRLGLRWNLSPRDSSFLVSSPHSLSSQTSELGIIFYGLGLNIIYHSTNLRIIPNNINNFFSLSIVIICFLSLSLRNNCIKPLNKN